MPNGNVLPPLAHQLRNEEVMADVRARFSEEDNLVFDHHGPQDINPVICAIRFSG